MNYFILAGAGQAKFLTEAFGGEAILGVLIIVVVAGIIYNGFK